MLKKSTGSIGTVSNITDYVKELELLITGEYRSPIISTDSTVEDPSEFALEKHLEDFLVQNWKQTDLGKDFDIFEEDGELVGQQYQSDTGPMDILAICPCQMARHTYLLKPRMRHPSCSWQCK